MKKIVIVRIISNLLLVIFWIGLTVLIHKQIGSIALTTFCLIIGIDNLLEKNTSIIARKSMKELSDIISKINLLLNKIIIRSNSNN